MHGLLIKIILCHLLGDFVLQTDKMVSDINNKKFRSRYFWLHILIHFLLLLSFTAFEKNYILPVILLSIAHLAIDAITKFILAPKINAISNLLIDQALHFLSILIFINHFYPQTIGWAAIFNTENYLVLATVISLSYVTSIVIKKTMSIFNYDIPQQGLHDAGKYIGILERLFILLFASMSFWEGVGFLLAAKSIFRFGDLKEQKDLKLTEYILIGTLLSFGIAILVSLAYLNIKNQL